ncbi:MAG TPA: PAS domain-containing protein, partial [Rhodoferax sp.]
MKSIKPQGGNTAQPGNLAINPEIWRNVFDAIEDPIFLHDAEFRVLLANRAYCRTAGVTEAQALGKPCWEVFPPGTGPLPGCKDAVSGKGQTSLQEEVNVGAKLFSSQEEVNVGEKLFLSKGYTVRDDQGKPLYSLHVLSDITAQRQGVAKLSESENRFRLIAETITEVFWMADVAVGKMFYISPAYEHIWGRSTQSLYENPGSFIEAIHPDDVTRVLADLELEKTGQPFDHEYRIHRPDGTLRWIWDRGFPIHEPTGEVLRYVGIAQDITERKRAEEALKKSEARYRSFIEVTGQLAWVAGADGAVVEDIPTWRAFAGMTAEQVKGWGWTEALHPDDREHAAQMWREAVARKGVYELEYRVRRRDGIYRDFFARGVPVLDASGGVREWVGTSIDITERKRTEAALRENQARLDLALRSARMGVWHLDIIENRRYFDDQVCRLLGINPTTFTGAAEEFFGAVHPDDRETIKASLARTIEQDVPYELAFRAVWPDGSVRYITSRG